MTPTFTDPPDPVPDDAPVASLIERRLSRRVLCIRPVVLEGTLGAVHARVYDLSEGGFLAEVHAEPDRTADEALEDVRQNLGVPFRVWFTDPFGVPLALPAEVVRTVPASPPGNGVRVGCRLLRPLTAPEKITLGLDEDPDGPFVSAAAPGPCGWLYPVSATFLGPLGAMRLCGARGTLVWMTARSLDAVLASTVVFPLVRIVVPQGRRRWSTLARVIDVRRREDGPEEIKIRAEAEDALPARLGVPSEW